MLLIGPPCSGKTTRVLRALETAIRADRSDEVLLLVPTASMKHHLLNLLARRTLMVPSRLVSTMSELVRDFTPGVAEVGGAVADRMLRAVIERVAPGQMPSRSGLPGLRNQIATLIGEFWAAGSDGFQIAAAMRTRQQRAFLDVFLEYEERLRHEGLVHRNQRIAQAAARIRVEGLEAVRSVYLDGFDRFTKPQETLLDALEEQAEEILVAMPADLPRYPLQRHKVKLLPELSRDGPVVETVQAQSPRAEVLEIARRILASDRPLREHGIVLRSSDQYEHLIREVFETLAIPVRLWDRGRLSDHGVARHFVNWLRIVERQFPAERTIEALASPLTPAGDDDEVDAYDFEARRRLPNEGLDFLRTAAREHPGPKRFLEGLTPYNTWHRKRLDVERWTQECLRLLGQVQSLPVPFQADGVSFRRSIDWREATQAHRALRTALAETAKLPEFRDGGLLSLAEFTDALEDVLRFTSLIRPGQPREVVHILPILEARQWALPVVFVCGLVDGWFPRHFSEDTVFDDEDRRRLRGRGIELRTTSERAREERFLYRVASTRATAQLILSYPIHDSAGKPVMRSSYLDSAPAPREAGWTALGDIRKSAPALAREALPTDLRAVVAKCNRRFSVSGISNFRQCPYLYFSGNTMRLRGRPPPPERRLDGAAIGSIVHTALLRWNQDKRPIGTILDEAFRVALNNLYLPVSFRTEQLRLALRADLVRFAQDQGASMGVYEGNRAYFEDDREYRIEELDSQPVVRCRIDRYDMDEFQRCFVTDYKYARPDRVRAILKQHLMGEQLQLMLYLAALEQDARYAPAGMLLCGLRGETSYAGVSVDGAGGLDALTADEMRQLLDTARSEAARAVGGILQGAIAVRPRDRAFCKRICEFGSVCRVDWAAAEASDGLAEGTPPCG